MSLNTDPQKQPERKALGRGLAALFQDVETQTPTELGANEKKTENVVQGPGRILELSKIERNAEQPRRHFDESKIQELSDSIREQGLVQPIVVRKLSEDRYQIVAGERRWRAAQKAGLTEVPVFIREEKLTQVDHDLASLVENIQREELNAIELALAYDRLLKKDSQLTQEALAKKLGVSRTALANTLRLLKLPEGVRKMIVEGKISEGHSRALLSLGSDAQMLQMAQHIVDDSLSVRDVEGQVKQLGQPTQNITSTTSFAVPTPFPTKKEKDAELRSLEEELREIYGTKVTFKGNSVRGTVEIFYTGSDSLNRVLHLLRAAK